MRAYGKKMPHAAQMPSRMSTTTAALIMFCPPPAPTRRTDREARLKVRYIIWAQSVVA